MKKIVSFILIVLLCVNTSTLVAQTSDNAILIFDCDLPYMGKCDYEINSIPMGNLNEGVTKIEVPSGEVKIKYTIPLIILNGAQLSAEQIEEMKAQSEARNARTMDIYVDAGQEYVISCKPMFAKYTLLNVASDANKIKKIKRTSDAISPSKMYFALASKQSATDNAPVVASSTTSTSNHAAQVQMPQQPKSSSPKRILSDVDKNIPVTNKKAENTFVLIVANEDYQFVDDVDFALNDGNTFKEYCVKTLGVPERQVWLYENASYGVINAGVSKMVQAMDFFDNPNAIVYYCGHGIPDEKTGDAYIIPTDGNGKDMATCYSLNKLYQTFANTKASKITYFMDACFTGASKEGSMLVAARGVAREPKKETLSGKSVVFSATSADETAMAYKEKQHGLFTYFLLKKLQETQGNVSYAELQEYINKNVKKESFLTNEKPQTPIVATSPAVKDSWKGMTLK